MRVAIIPIFAAVLLTACATTPQFTPTTSREKEAAPYATALHASRDDMNETTYYSSDISPFAPASLAVSSKDDKTVILFMRFARMANKWLFFKHIQISADGKKVFDRYLDPSRISRKVESGHYSALVSERATYGIRQEDMPAIRQIINAKTVIVRLAGDGYEDKQLSTATIARMRSAVATFDALSATGTPLYNPD